MYWDHFNTQIKEINMSVQNIRILPKTHMYLSVDDAQKKHSTLYYFFKTIINLRIHSMTL